MATLLERFRQRRIGQSKRESQMIRMPGGELSRQVASPAVDIAPNDPIVAYFLSAPGAVEIDKLHLESPALRALKAAGVKLVVPLVSQGELVGLLNLGPHLSEQDYSTDDRVLLNNLAIQAAPAVRVAQLVREQQAQVRARERIEQELRVARLIQQTLLPRDLPAIPGWRLSARYLPAREVGGDFYDFLYFEDGRLGIVIGDVTDKGVPAALVMATTRSVLRSAAQRLISPSQVLERVNDSIYDDIPPKMFVTCLYALLDPATGRLQYANAGHDLPYRRHKGGVSELRATGMPLGLMPGMSYEEKETLLEPGESILFYSDGIVEAHNPERDMFSFPRLMELVGKHADAETLIDFLLAELATFTGPDWEQEDDVTMVTLHRSEGYGVSEISTRSAMRLEEKTGNGDNNNGDWRTLAEWTLPSEPGNERLAMERVAEAVEPLKLPKKRLEELKTAVAEATMNAMEHGNHYQADVLVSIQVQTSQKVLSVQIRDQGSGQPIPSPEEPDLEAKLAELQTPRGWGLFLIKNLVDDMRITSDENHHTIELIINL
jgi:serine phosphatase RsbU (regulator of sigma subunit)/anti-sigma regulatory factor (Ser/Thr protein kinase)